MLNMDFSQTLTVATAAQDWLPSPSPGVLRKPLAREEAEGGHATSVVRYQPGASFHSHNHPGGEEILVLEGTFSDETGDFGEGTYFRNPVGFTHAPFSQDGCLIFVKLHQFCDGDENRIAIQTHDQLFQPVSPGLEMLKLHEYGSEQVHLIRMAPASVLDLSQVEGVEWFLLRGSVSDEQSGESFDRHYWHRAPGQSALKADTAAVLWLKTGHF